MVSGVSLAQQLVRKSLLVAQFMVEPYANGAMNSLVRITRNGTWNQSGGEWDPTGTAVIYADDQDPELGAAAGITGSTGPSYLDVGDEPEYYDMISVMIPRSSQAEPQIDDLLQVMYSPDVDIIGRYFRVTGFSVGGRLMPSTTMQCSGLAKSKRWGPT